MEKLSPEQIAQMSREEIAARFNILVERMDEVHNEVINLPNYPRSLDSLGTDLSNRFLRIVDRLRRPFAATAYCDSGVKATMIHPK